MQTKTYIRNIVLHMLNIEFNQKSILYISTLILNKYCIMVHYFNIIKTIKNYITIIKFEPNFCRWMSVENSC